MEWEGPYFFVMYSEYGLAVNFGTTLLLRGHGGVGIIVNVPLAILFGSMSLALIALEMRGELFRMPAVLLQNSGKPSTVFRSLALKVLRASGWKALPA